MLTTKDKTDQVTLIVRDGVAAAKRELHCEAFEVRCQRGEDCSFDGVGSQPAFRRRTGLIITWILLSANVRLPCADVLYACYFALKLG